MSESLPTLRAELQTLFNAESPSVQTALAVKGRNDRIDAITRTAREVYSHSSLCLMDSALCFFDGRCYTQITPEELLTITRNILVDMGASPSDLRTMGSMPMDIISEKAILSDKNLLCFDNCVLNIATGKTSRFSPSLPVKERLNYPYARRCACVEWQRFVEWAIPEPQERACLQEFCGLCYIDRSKMSVEKFAVLVGKGANGKSVFCEAIKSAMGKDNTTNLDPQQLTSEKMIPYLIGKRLNCSPDVRASASFDSALKALASGQSVTGRKIYGDAVDVNCPPIIFSLNTLPRFKDTTEGFFRRLLVFSFDSYIAPERQDRNLASRLAEKGASGILNWILEGRERLIRNGGNFTRSPRMEAALQRIREEAIQDSTPAIDYLARKGYLTEPLFDGQKPVKIGATEIFVGLGERVSKTAISQELLRAGVRMVRNREMYYCVYDKNARR